MDRRLYEAIRNRTEIAEIKYRYLYGTITREEAEALAKPVIDRINYAVRLKTQEFNAKYETQRKPYKTSFTSLMR